MRCDVCRESVLGEPYFSRRKVQFMSAKQWLAGFLSAVLFVQSAGMYLPRQAWAGSEDEKPKSKDVVAEVSGAATTAISEDPGATAGLAKIARVEKQIADSTETSLPPRLDGQNFYHLPGQTLEIPTGEKDANDKDIFAVYDLSRPTIDVPKILVSAGDFESQIRIVPDQDSKSLLIQKIKGEKILAQQRILQTSVVAWTYDEEIFTFVKEDGSVHAINMNVLRAGVFKVGGIPVYKIRLNKTSDEKMPASFFAALKAGHKLQMTWASRGLKPFASHEVAADAALESALVGVPSPGNLVLYSRDARGVRTLIADVSRNALEDDMIVDAEVLGASSKFFVGSNPEESRQVVESARTAEVAERLSALKLNPAEVSAVMAISPAQLKWIADSVEVQKGSATRTRDVYKDAEEAHASYEKLYSKVAAFVEQAKTQKEKDQINADAQEGDLGDHWQDLERLVVSPPEVRAKALRKPINRTALKTLAGLAGLAVAGAVGNGIVQHHDPLWALHMISEMRQLAIPAILREGSPVPKAAIGANIVFWISTLLPVAFAYKFIGKMKKWSAGKTFVQAAMRVFGAVTYVNPVGVMKLLRQKNAPGALRAGISPLTQVTPASDVGRQLDLKDSVRPVLNAPWASQQKIDRNKEVLDAVHLRNLQIRALASSLAVLIVASESGIPSPILEAFLTQVDPVKTKGEWQAAALKALQGNAWTALLQEQGFDELVKKPEFQEHLSRTAEALSNMFRNTPAMKADLSRIAPSEFAFYVAAAREVARAVKKTSKSEKAVDWVANAWTQGLDQFQKSVGSANDKADYLMQAESTPLNEKQSPAQLAVDWPVMAVQEVIVGARADISTEETQKMLGVDPHGFGWTNWGNGTAADRLMQLLIYLTTGPARQELNYGQPRLRAETNYDPVERVRLSYVDGDGDVQTTPQIVTRKEWAFDSVVNWAKKIPDLKNMQYGSFAIKDMKRRFEYIVPIAILDLMCRLGFSDQSFKDAGLGFLTTQQRAWLFIGLFWHFVYRAQGLVNGEMQGDLVKYISSLETIERGQKLGDADLVKKAVEELTKLYTLNSNDVPAELREALVKAEELLGVPQSQLIATDKNLAPYVSAVALLEQAVVLAPGEGPMDIGYRKRVAGAYKKLRDLYINEEVAFDLMDARALLNFAKKSPPVVTQVNPLAKYLIVFLGGVLPTNYTGTLIFADSYGAGLGKLFLAWVPIIGGLYTAAYGVEKAVQFLAKNAAKKKELMEQGQKIMEGIVEARAQENLSRATPGNTTAAPRYCITAMKR